MYLYYHLMMIDDAIHTSILRTWMQIFGLENQCFWLQVARSQSYRILSFAPIDLPKTMPWFFEHLACFETDLQQFGLLLKIETTCANYRHLVKS